MGGAGNQSGNSVRQTSDGGYIIAGYDDLGGLLIDVFLIKTGSSGNSVWEKTFGLDGIDSGSAVEQTAEGGYVIVGTTTSAGSGGSDIYFIKTDPDGNAQ